VKTSLISAALVAVLAAGAAATLAFAQGGAPGPNGQNIAVIDVGVVFEKHPRFKASMDSLKAEIDATEKGWKDEATKMNAMIEQMKGLRPDSPDYHRMEKELATHKADFDVNKALKNKELMEKQGKIYFNTYKEVEDTVKEFCSHYNVALVIRYNSKPIDNSDPQEILRGIQRPIVFIKPGYDITDDIVGMLNRSAAVPANGGGRIGVR
jgi:Skp family chaperone for outer membrane proteins